uniref:Phospholipid scramblase n=1 Tax=Panagrolaimus davidi TaxID=227884 RepID=A0A914PNI1_9BILA
MLWVKRKEGPDLSLSKGKTFTVDNAKIHLVTKYSEEEGCSEIMNINDGKTLLIEDKLPGFAVHLCNCKVIKYLIDGPVHLEHEDFKLLKIKNVLQVSEKPLSLKEYIAENADDGCLDCWITPVKTVRRCFCEWVIVPSSVPSEKCYLYPKRIDTVVGIGKISIRQGTYKYYRFVNCPKEYVLGSTYASIYGKGEINGNEVTFLVLSKPLKLQRRYMETFVTPGGSVLVLDFLMILWIYLKSFVDQNNRW